MEMMECRRDLNQRLQKCFFRLRCVQPHGLPMFVRGKEFACAVTPQAFRKRSLCPVQNHRDIEMSAERFVIHFLNTRLQFIGYQFRHVYESSGTSVMSLFVGLA